MGDIQEMAITSGLVEIILRYTFLGQKCETPSYWSPGGAAWVTANATQGAEAWWNEVKTVWRAMAVTSGSLTFDSVFFQEIGGGLEYGEYAVPSGEREGTRDGASLGAFLPAYVAVGCRLSVTTRATRPGQKRFPFPTEADNNDGHVEAAYLSLVAAVAEKYSTPLIMGAPVATGTLTPQVAGFTGSPPTLRAQQEAVGYVLNGLFTSQVSRRPGHGA